MYSAETIIDIAKAVNNHNLAANAHYDIYAIKFREAYADWGGKDHVLEPISIEAEPVHEICCRSVYIRNLWEDAMAISKVADFYDDADDFERDLDSAGAAAVTEREIDFVSSIRDKYEEWGAKMFLSDSQYAWLQRIIDGD